MLKHVETTKEFAETIKEGTTVVDFYADWCGPCRMLAPIFEEVSKELSDIPFLKVNVDKLQDIAINYRVSSIPTIIIFKDGKVDKIQVGYIDQSKLLNLVKSSL